MARLAGVSILVVVAAVSVGRLVVGQQRPSGPEAEPMKPRPVQVAAAEPHEAPFDGDRAIGYLEDLCKIGPRISGSEGMRKQQALLRKHFESLGGKVTLQRFTARQKSQRQSTEMANLVVSWWPDRQRRVLLCSHYDTRPIADQEPDIRRWREPFLSANDGGSGVALLMELAHQIKDVPAVGVDMVFFDGEEYVFDPRPDGDTYFFGSEHFAREYRQGRPKCQYGAGVLLDMVGGKDAHFPIERNSWLSAAALVQTLWQTAAKQGCAAFRNELGFEVRDDHIALNRAGIPTVDVIDFDYAHWHRLSDVPANGSADSLTQVARVLWAWLEQAR